MKSVLTFALLLSVTLLYSQKLRLASDVWPPFTDEAPKRAFALDLVQEALAHNKVQVETNILGFTEVMEGIRSAKFDGSAALWYSPERASYLLYSEPYLENRLILVGKKGSDVSVDSLSKLKGKRIAVVESYAYGSLLDNAKNVELVPGSSDQQNLQRLLKGDVDYMLVDALLIEYLLEYQSEETAHYLEIGKVTLLSLPLYFAIRKETPGAAKIIADFNEEIKKMKTDGTYNRILQLNWVSTDVDGDGIPELVLNGDKAGIKPPMSSYMLLYPAHGSEASGGYVIEGSTYNNWENVPEKYKVPQAKLADTDKRGFGPVFTF